MKYQIEYDKEQAVYLLYSYILVNQEVLPTLVHRGTYDECLHIKEQLE